MYLSLYTLDAEDDDDTNETKYWATAFKVCDRNILYNEIILMKIDNILKKIVSRMDYKLTERDILEISF